MDTVKVVSRAGVASIALFMAMAACSGTEVAQTSQQVGSTTVTTDLTSYTPGQAITVSWTGSPGSPNDWVAIVPAGSPADSGFLEWHFTNGAVDGSQAFAGLSAGDYEARVYPEGSYATLASATFTVVGGGSGSGSGSGGGTVTVTTDKAMYGAGASITMSWAGMPGASDDWVALVPAGSPVDSGFLEWHFTNGAVNGSQVFAGVSNGTYEVRAYQSGSYTILGAATFSVSGISTDMANYPVGQSITVSWTGTPGHQDDWVAIVPAGSPPDSGFVQWFFTNGQVSGSQVFDGLAAGSYEARTYLSGSYTVMASTAFTVAGGPPPPPPQVTLTTDMSGYAPGQSITVSWSNMPGKSGEWVAIVPAGSPPDSGFIQWFFTGGQATGSQLFDGLAAGSYEARIYADGSYTVVASAAFSVM